jgi:hypothetical protein
MKQTRLQVVGVVVGSLAVIAAGCGSEGPSVTAPSPAFSAGAIHIAPAGAIVGTAVSLESRDATDPSGAALSYSWDFGDGETGSGEATTHVYRTSGTFMARLTVTSFEAGSAETTLYIPVDSLTARWSGDFGTVSITQDGLDLRGTYEDGGRQGLVEGRISDTGTVTFTMTGPDTDPVTFTGTAGRDVMTLVGEARGRDAANRPLTLTRG